MTKVMNFVERVELLHSLGLEVDREGNWSHENITSDTIDGAPLVLFTRKELLSLDNSSWEYEVEEIKDKLEEYNSRFI